MGPPHSWLAAEASQKLGKSIGGHLARAETWTNQFGWLLTIPPFSLTSQPNCLGHLAKRLGRIEWHLVTHHVVTRPCESLCATVLRATGILVLASLR
jgi:hypothetical protein